MEHKTGNNQQNTDWIVGILGSMVVLLSAVCVGILTSDSLRSAIRSSVGLVVEQSTLQTVESRINRDQAQLLAIASALNLAADTHDLSGAVQTLVAERQDLSGKYNDLTTRHNALTTQHATLNREHGDLRNAKAEYEARVRNATHKLSSNLSSKLVKTSARQVASTPGKAIPFFGIGFVAAFTAIDVYEACEMIKALHEMNIELGTQADTNNRDTVCGLKVPTQDELRTQISKNWQAAYTSAAAAANEAGKSFSMTPPTIEAQQFTKQTCSIFGGTWLCP